MGKTDKILELFPAFYRATDRHKLLHGVVDGLAAPLEAFDTYLFRIQRAHRIKVADHVDDIVRLAAALNLTPFHFEDVVAQLSVPYAVRVDLLRERVARLVRLHLRGLGTPWAALETAAVFLNAEIVPRTNGEPLVRHLDADRCSHEASIGFPRAEGQPRERIYLHENPWRRRKVEPVERWQGDVWPVDNADARPAPLRIAIQGIGERTVRPIVYSPAAQEGILFHGIVRDAETLVIDAVDGASIVDRPVDEWVTHFRGGAWDDGVFDAARFTVSRWETDEPFGGDPSQAIVRPFERVRPVPAAPPGRSEWSLRMTEGIWNGSLTGFGVYAFPDEPVGLYDRELNFDTCVYDVGPSAVAGAAWDERLPCSFKLLLPARIPALQSGDDAAVDPATRCGAAAPAPAPPAINYAGRVGSVLPRVKPAGIRAFVDTAADAWVLGESVLRDGDSLDEEGTGYHATIVRRPNADAFIPFDASDGSR